MTGDIDSELLICAKINFMNIEKKYPFLKKDPLWHIPMAQLNEGLGGETVEHYVERVCRENNLGIRPSTSHAKGWEK